MRIIKILKNNVVLFSVILFLGFTGCIYAPYELYLTNVNEFWFSLKHFWIFPVIFWICASLFAYILGMVLKKGLRLLYEAMLFSLGLLFYIQGNFLNLSVGVLNGAQIDWTQYNSEIYFNLSIWGAAFLIIVLVAIFKEKIFKVAAKYLSWYLVGIQLLALIVMLFSHGIEASEKQSAANIITDKGLYELGTEENVVVFMLDMFDDAYFKEILFNEPEIKKELDGFTYFSNHSGSYATTHYSLIHLMSGKLYYGSNKGIEPVAEWLNNQDDGYLNVYKNKDYKMNFYTGGTICIPQNIIDDTDNYVNVDLKINTPVKFLIKLYQLVACKYFPDFVKPYIWMDGAEFNDFRSYDLGEENVEGYSDNNTTFRKKLSLHGIKAVEGEKSFKFIHLIGAHYPYTINENADPVEENSVSDVQCARGVLRIVQEYIEEMKKQGVYENTAIVLIADHGYYWDGVLSNPVLLVKPRNSKGELKISDAPVSQTDFAATLYQLGNFEGDNLYGESVFDIEEGTERDRYFYHYYLNEGSDLRLIEYRIPSESNDPNLFEMTDVEYTPSGEKIVHSEYCITCKEKTGEIVHQKAKNYPE